MYRRTKIFLLFNFLVPVSFFIFTVYFMPIGQVFQFDPSDEGIELIKAILYLDGFPMYTEMWNDQPPFSTAILAFWMEGFGKSIYSARLLTLCYSTILVWSFCQTLRIYLGNFIAIVGTLLLIISCNFLRLSVSVMIGLPSLAMVMLSVFTLALYKQNCDKQYSQLLIYISGAFLAISLQIKLFSAFIVPVIIFDILQFNFKKHFQRQLKWSLFFDATLWIIGFSTIYILIGILFNSLNYQELLKTHFDHSVKAAFSRGNSLKLTLSFLLQDFDYLLLAILAIKTIIQRKQWENTLPIIWLITGFIVLLNHRPVWYHHYLLLSIPLTWLASYGLTLSLDFFRQWRWSDRKNFSKITVSSLAGGLAILSILLIPVKLGVTIFENHEYVAQSQDNVQFVNMILKHKESTRWLFTDCPIYAFYSSLPIPPEIAVLSDIRIKSKTITPEQILAVVKTYHPEQVLLCKSKIIQSYLASYINQHYLKIYANHLGSLYLVKEISPSKDLYLTK